MNQNKILREKNLSLVKLVDILLNSNQSLLTKLKLTSHPSHYASVQSSLNLKEFTGSDLKKRTTFDYPSLSPNPFENLNLKHQQLDEDQLQTPRQDTKENISIKSGISNHKIKKCINKRNSNLIKRITLNHQNSPERVQQVPRKISELLPIGESSPFKITIKSNKDKENENDKQNLSNEYNMQEINNTNQNVRTTFHNFDGELGMIERNIEDKIMKFAEIKEYLIKSFKENSKIKEIFNQIAVDFKEIVHKKEALILKQLKSLNVNNKCYFINRSFILKIAKPKMRRSKH